MNSGFSEQELTNLQRQLDEELLLTRKFRQYSDLCTDPELRSLCLQIAHLHQGHFNVLLQNLTIKKEEELENG